MRITGLHETLVTSQPYSDLLTDKDQRRLVSYRLCTTPDKGTRSFAPPNDHGGTWTQEAEGDKLRCSCEPYRHSTPTTAKIGGCSSPGVWKLHDRARGCGSPNGPATPPPATPVWLGSATTPCDSKNGQHLKYLQQNPRKQCPARMVPTYRCACRVCLNYELQVLMNCALHMLVCVRVCVCVCVCACVCVHACVAGVNYALQACVASACTIRCPRRPPCGTGARLSTVQRHTCIGTGVQWLLHRRARGRSGIA